MGKSMYKKLKREESLSDLVAAEIQKLITSDALSAGERLPPARDLAKKFGVSRTVIREALTLLKAKGLVSIQHGSGAIVTTVPPDYVSESIYLFLSQFPENIEYFHVLELRKMVEIEIAGLAAQHATPDDLTRMDAAIQRMEHVKNRINTDEKARQEFAEADLSFHLAVAAATKNPLLPMIFSPIVNKLINHITTALEFPGSLEQGMLYHEYIFKAVKNKDVSGAKKAMGEHLEFSETIMREEFEKNRGNSHDTNASISSA